MEPILLAYLGIALMTGLTFIGSIPNTEIFDIDKEDNYIVVNNNYQTNIDYVYAIGDVIKKDVYQLTTAVGDATIAANSIIKKEANNK